MTLSLRLYLFHLLSRMLGFRLVYTDRFIATALKKQGRGRVTWSTIDPRRAASQWAATGDQHGQGTHFLAVEAHIGAKTVSKAKHTLASTQYDLENAIRTDSGLPAGIPDAPHAGPPAAHRGHAQAAAGEGAVGHRAQHHEPAAGKVDLADLVAKDLN